MKLLEEDIWKNDGITRNFKKEHGEILNDPSKMEIGDLANACTYCKVWDNPYARAIIKRAGLYDRFDSTRNLKHRKEIFDKACEGFGIKIV